MIYTKSSIVIYCYPHTIASSILIQLRIFYRCSRLQIRLGLICVWFLNRAQACRGPTWCRSFR